MNKYTDPTHILQVSVPLNADAADAFIGKYDPYVATMQVVLNITSMRYEDFICGDIQVVMDSVEPESPAEIDDGTVNHAASAEWNSGAPESPPEPVSHHSV